MADWSKPTTADTYSNFLTFLANRDVDAGTLYLNVPTNQPTGAIRYNRGTNLFEEWDGALWNVKVLAIAGGGTGLGTAAGARTALGLGTMATQNSNAVAITGGSIAGVTLDAGTITSGTVALVRGGTGASLALGANGAVMQSNGVSVVFGNIFDVNVDAAAAISWSKISKLSSSLLDLATRSAADLNSGLLPDARLGTNVFVKSSTSVIKSLDGSAGTPTNILIGTFNAVPGRWAGIYSETNGYDLCIAAGAGVKQLQALGDGIHFPTFVYYLMSSPTALSADQTAWNPFVTTGECRVSATAPVNILGIVSGVDGQVGYLHNLGSSTITFVHNGAAGFPGVKLFCTGGANIALPQFSSVRVVYSSTDAAWIVTQG